MTCLWRHSTLFNRPESHTKSRQNVLVIILYSRILSLLLFSISWNTWIILKRGRSCCDLLYKWSAYEYDQYSQISLKCKRDVVFPTGNNRKEVYLQRQFSVFRMLLLPRGSCAALNLNISLKGRNKEQLTQDIIGTDKTGLKSFTQNKGWKRYCWNWSFCIDWSINGRNNEYI